MGRGAGTEFATVPLSGGANGLIGGTTGFCEGRGTVTATAGGDGRPDTADLSSEMASWARKRAASLSASCAISGSSRMSTAWSTRPAEAL